MRKNKREKRAMANRQRGGAAEERRRADEEKRRPGKYEEESGRLGALTDEATRWADEEARRERKDAASDLAAVGTQQFRTDNSPPLRLFYL